MFSYIDKKYNLGPYVELLTQLDVPDFEYDSIVSAIEKLDSNYKDIKILSYEKITKNDYLKWLININNKDEITNLLSRL